MRWALAIPAICVAVPALSQTFEDEPWIDYDLLFTQNADGIVYDTDKANRRMAVLNLPGEVRVERRGTAGNYTYRSADCSTDGGVGQLLALFMALRATGERCEGFATPDQMDRLQSILDRMGPYAAANAVPPQSWAQLEPLFMKLMEKEMRPECKAVFSEDSWFPGFLMAAVREDGDARLAELMAVPQLPVWGKSCH
jgi:hypothetical protein